MKKKENNVKKVKDVKKCKKRASETLIPIDWLKSAIPISLSTISVNSASTCSKFRPQKKKCDPHSTFSVS